MNQNKAATAGLGRILIILTCLYLVDMAGATWHAAIGPQYEANPLMRALFETSILAAVTVKLAILVWFTWAALACARVNYRLARVLAMSAAALYAVPAAFYAGLACAYGYKYLALAVR